MEVSKIRAWVMGDPGVRGSAGYRAVGGRQGAVGALVRTVGDGRRPGGQGGAGEHTDISLGDPTHAEVHVPCGIGCVGTVCSTEAWRCIASQC